MDYINAPYGAFTKAVRKYDEDYGRKEDTKKIYTIEYNEVEKTITKHRVEVEAYTYEDAENFIERMKSEFVIDDKEIMHDNDCSYEDFELVGCEELEDD